MAFSRLRLLVGGNYIKVTKLTSLSDEWQSHTSPIKTAICWYGSFRVMVTSRDRHASGSWVEVLTSRFNTETFSCLKLWNLRSKFKSIFSGSQKTSCTGVRRISVFFQRPQLLADGCNSILCRSSEVSVVFCFSFYSGRITKIYKNLYFEWFFVLISVSSTQIPLTESHFQMNMVLTLK